MDKEINAGPEKKIKPISKRKNLTLATLTALMALQACTNGEYVGSDFYKKGNQLYLEVSEHGESGKITKKMQKIDGTVESPETFQLLDRNYGKDESHVYRIHDNKLTILEGIDPKSFIGIAGGLEVD